MKLIKNTYVYVYCKKNALVIGKSAAFFVWAGVEFCKGRMEI